MSVLSKGATIASMAALMALSMTTANAAKHMAPAPANAAASSGKMMHASDKVHCYGINSCKGTADCKTAENACKGMNACKGHGFKAMDAKTCLNKDGAVGDL